MCTTHMQVEEVSMLATTTGLKQHTRDLSKETKVSRSIISLIPGPREKANSGEPKEEFKTN
jgi:hypothetical protein